MPSPYETPYNQVRFKATHNSYDRGLSLDDQLNYLAADPSRGGCRGLELDLVQEKGSWEWCVQHGGGYSNESASFVDWLRKLVQWSGDVDHDPIWITLDLKGSSGGRDEFSESLDAAISREVPKAKLFTPGHLIGDASSLAEGAARGWPPVAALKKKFLLCLSGTESRKQAYAAYRPAERLCFADRDYLHDSASHPKQITGNRIVINHKVGAGGAATLQLKQWRAQSGLFIRAYGIDSRALWKRGVERGVNVLSTNADIGQSWARIDANPFEAITT